MENAQLVGLSRQMALRRELEVVANNIANLGTAGFKSEQVKFSEYLMPVASAEIFPNNRDKRLSYVEDRATWQDFSAGPIQITNNQLDLAIDGEAFFAIQTPEGVRYTRNGQFQLDTQGTLVTNEGYPVMSTSGPIQFADTETAITVGKDGTVSTDQGPRGRLLLTTFGDPQSLVATGSSMFRAEGIGAELAPGQGGIQQYAVEKSNVQAVVETTRLVELTRAYSTLAQMMQRGDELRRTAIERLGDVTA
ncbi:flagellar basal-body rod protein FlgF [Terrihabitans soli]|uniref:Flagellar basal-body rod protein FlgF n=1 Tax=Terrihabitans soli TaxID=708113 RepID=A0A6S6QX52_9HYPH|nr:flagellar basal-body rod protein FlgF [Terrihabitans soli]BCJ91611.1 flagellar basal-body rod protein FlgF [Terrihabitans soli]